MSDVFSLEWMEVSLKKLLQHCPEVSKGWVVDLRENTGGSIFPMIGSMAPFFTNPFLGGFYLKEENSFIKEKLLFEKGKLYFATEGVSFYSIPETLELNSLPVIVLIGKDTSSSGEFLALALSFQPNTTLMGEPTFGMANVNASFPLPEDLGFIMLSMGYFLDANCQPFKTMQIKPDIEITGSSEEVMSEAIKLLEMNNG